MLIFFLFPLVVYLHTWHSDMGWQLGALEQRRQDDLVGVRVPAAVDAAQPSNGQQKLVE